MGKLKEKVGTTIVSAAIIDDVDSVTVGVKNVSLKAKDVLHADVVDNTAVTTDVIIPVHEVYTLYKDNGYVIAAVVIGEDEGTNTNYAYITGSSYNSEGYSSANDEWTWSKEAVVDGKIVDLTEKGSTIKHLNKMTQGNWYEVRYDADGNVRGIKAQSAPNNGTNGAIKFVNNPASNKYPNTSLRATEPSVPSTTLRTATTATAAWRTPSTIWTITSRAT